MKAAKYAEKHTSGESHLNFLTLISITGTVAVITQEAIVVIQGDSTCKATHTKHIVNE